MNENKAIEILNHFDMQVSAKADGAYQTNIGKVACMVAVKALSEIQEYRVIGTIEECKEAREKQQARKVNNKKPLRDFNDSIYDVKGDCPNCKNNLLLSIHTRYCSECSQKLDWKE